MKFHCESGSLSSRSYCTGVRYGVLLSGDSDSGQKNL